MVIPKKHGSARVQSTRSRKTSPKPKAKPRQKPGAMGRGKFYRIEVRPKNQFVIFRTQDVGMRGGLERLAGKRPNGSWDTVAWLISKDDAHINENGRLTIDHAKVKTVMSQIRGPITHVKGDIFAAKPLRTISEKQKPTAVERKARSINKVKVEKARKRGETES